jgi:hypothetical protein
MDAVRACGAGTSFPLDSYLGLHTPKWCTLVIDWPRSHQIETSLPVMGNSTSFFHQAPAKSHIFPIKLSVLMLGLRWREKQRVYGFWTALPQGWDGGGRSLWIYQNIRGSPIPPFLQIWLGMGHANMIFYWVVCHICSLPKCQLSRIWIMWPIGLHKWGTISSNWLKVFFIVAIVTDIHMNTYLCYCPHTEKMSKVKFGQPY